MKSIFKFVATVVFLTSFMFLLLFLWEFSEAEQYTRSHLNSIIIRAFATALIFEAGIVLYSKKRNSKISSQEN